MNIHNFLLQFAVIYGAFIHCPMEQAEPNLYRGSDPKIKDIYALHDKGFKTIISLRTHPQKNKATLCEKRGMNWVQIPSGVFKTPTSEQLDQFRAIVKDPKNLPCYVACEVDMDRTGVYLAAYRMVDLNWSYEQIKADFKKHHQKIWWPPFRKYPEVVLKYAEAHKQMQQNGAG
jgi:protein tyrosine/serine phosphatase